MLLVASWLCTDLWRSRLNIEQDLLRLEWRSSQDWVSSRHVECRQFWKRFASIHKPDEFLDPAYSLSDSPTQLSYQQIWKRWCRARAGKLAPDNNSLVPFPNEFSIQIFQESSHETLKLIIELKIPGMITLLRIKRNFFVLNHGRCKHLHRQHIIELVVKELLNQCHASIYAHTTTSFFLSNKSKMKFEFVVAEIREITKPARGNLGLTSISRWWMNLLRRLYRPALIHYFTTLSGPMKDDLFSDTRYTDYMWPKKGFDSSWRVHETGPLRSTYVLLPELQA